LLELVEIKSRFEQDSHPQLRPQGSNSTVQKCHGRSKDVWVSVLNAERMSSKLFSLAAHGRFLVRRSSQPRLVMGSLIFPSRHLSSSIFVSKHYEIDKNELKDVLEQMETRYRKSNDGYELQVCNFCNKGNKHKESNMWKLKVNCDGSYHCFRCSVHGTWFDLKRRLNSSYHNGNEIMQGSESFEKNNLLDGVQAKNDTAVIPDQVVMNSHAQQIQIKNDPNSKLAVDYLTQTRKISKPIFLK
jgi:hypothetical protein